MWPCFDHSCIIVFRTIPSCCGGPPGLGGATHYQPQGLGPQEVPEPVSTAGCHGGCGHVTDGWVVTDEWDHVIDEWGYVILGVMVAVMLKDYHFKLHTINLEVQSNFFFLPTICSFW